MKRLQLNLQWNVEIDLNKLYIVVDQRGSNIGFFCPASRQTYVGP